MQQLPYEYLLIAASRCITEKKADQTQPNTVNNVACEEVKNSQADQQPGEGLAGQRSPVGGPRRFRMIAQRMERSTRPPSSGKAGIRLKINTARLIPAR